MVALKGMNAIAMHVHPPIIEVAITVALRPHLENIKINIIPFKLLLHSVEVNYNNYGNKNIFYVIITTYHSLLIAYVCYTLVKLTFLLIFFFTMKSIEKLNKVWPP